MIKTSDYILSEITITYHIGMVKSLGKALPLIHFHKLEKESSSITESIATLKSAKFVNCGILRIPKQVEACIAPKSVGGRNVMKILGLESPIGGNVQDPVTNCRKCPHSACIRNNNKRNQLFILQCRSVSGVSSFLIVF